MSITDNTNNKDKKEEEEEPYFFETDPDKIFDYEPYHIEMPYQVGLGKIYDPYLIENQKNDDYFKKEYMLRATGVGERVFPDDVLQKCIELGNQYDPDNVDPYSDKFLLCDPAFYGSRFGVVICELVKGNVRVLFANDYLRKSTQQMIDLILDLRIKYRNIRNVMIDAASSEFIIDLKQYFEGTGQEYSHNYQEQIREWAGERYNNKKPWEMGMYIIPVPFNKRIDYTYRLKKAMKNGNYWVHPKFEKLLLAYETAPRLHNGDENEIDKQHTEYIDILDAQLCLFYRLTSI